MDVDRLTDWLERYFAAWRSNDGGDVAELFSADATYSYGPFREAAIGRDAIVERWVGGGEPADFTYRYEALAIVADRGIAHWAVGFADPSSSGSRVEMDGILVLTFDEAGLCTEHLEWYATRQVEAPAS